MDRELGKEDVSERFSDRVKRHRNILAYPPKEEDGKPLVLVVRNQLLVSQTVSEQAVRSLKRLKVTSRHLTSLLAGLERRPGIADVDLLELTFHTDDTIIDVTRKLREDLQAGGNHPQAVSPNHVLIPASWGHGCPYGPPSPVGALPKPAQPDGRHRAITVIDSGYQWRHDWGPNPLASLCHRLNVIEAEWLGPGGWQAGIPDTTDVDKDGRLDALAGHANFVAGVIAQHCRGADITIRNHNGGFAPNSDDFPTEAAVARSLYQSGDASVIDVGFAFASLDSQISPVWEAAFAGLGKTPVVAAPAGNQGMMSPRYPAALNVTLPGKFRNMIGVGSIDPPRPRVTPARSDFSNFGKWVTCSAVGSNVESTFLRVDMPVEEDPAPAPAPRDFGNAWACWNGTSFSTPRVVAAIAARLDGTNTPMQAWQALFATGLPSGDVGRMFP